MANGDTEAGLCDTHTVLMIFPELLMMVTVSVNGILLVSLSGSGDLLDKVQEWWPVTTDGGGA